MRPAIPRLALEVEVIGWWRAFEAGSPQREAAHELILPPGQTWPAAVRRGQAVDVRLTGPSGRALLRGVVLERRLRRARIRGIVIG